MDVDKEMRKTVEDLAKHRADVEWLVGRERASRVAATNGTTPLMAPSAATAEATRYDFAKLGEKIAESLIHAAEDQVTEAANNLERVKVFAEGLRSEVAIKSKELTEMNARLKLFGVTLVEAHKKFVGGDDDQPSGTS